MNMIVRMLSYPFMQRALLVGVLVSLCAALLGVSLVALIGLIFPEVDIRGAACVMFILPPPFVLPVFADDPEQRVYVSSVLTAYTIVTVVGFGVLAILV
jgi:ABC-type Mn2+/Zn2+ transport system permease subunit